MRTGYFVFLVLLSGCSDKAGTAPVDNAAAVEKLDVVEVMPAFLKIMDADPKADAAARAPRFRRDVIEAYPALYGPVVHMNADFDVAQYLKDLEPLIPAMRELTPLTLAQIHATVDLMNAKFGRMSGITIYLAPSLFTSNGQVRVVNDKPVVMFGVDVQAYAENEMLPAASRYDLRAYIAHELFHAHHYAVNAEMRRLANTLFDEKNPAPLYLNLWIEGLATCVSMSMDGDGTVERAFMSERLPKEVPPILATAVRELSGKLDSRSLDDTRDFFWLGGERKDLPPRSAYAIGALIADDVVTRRGLNAALALSGDELRSEVGKALETLSHHKVDIDWSRVCATSRL
jgi:hypothetical protein